MRKVLVTGGAGFIGSNFIRYLLDNSDVEKVYNLDCLTYAGNLRNVRDFDKDRHQFILGNILDKSLVRWIFETLKPDTVVHFAAETHVDRSIIVPEAFMNTNVMGTLNLLTYFYKSFTYGMRFHHVSTDEVYGSADYEPFKETTCYNPNSPYAASKAASDHVVRAFGHTYGIDYTISNCSNNYGPYQFPEKLIPRMILCAVTGENLPIHGDGSNVRDWLYVDDHSRAILKILKYGGSGETYNIGAGEEHTNLDVVHTLCGLLSDYEPQIEFVKDRLGNDKIYSLDFSKIMLELDWKPEINFENGLIQTVTWYQNNLDWLRETDEKLEFSGHDLFYRELKT